ncbi:F0F1 ATP synthase subunit A [Tautonia rosea]|uniref:F0F1 ATP synthase subunit A n=1 Tax=Tautonia rosea TaxID=2728037 RepID=UPI001472BDD0|nr:F0F1 ATP synthase subunit A [Tautonia rosea]
MDLLDLKQISPDEVVFWEWRFVTINATLVFTWVVMFVLVLGSWLVTRTLTTGPTISRWQNLLEVVVDGIRREIAGIVQERPERYLAFIGTLFLFIFLSNLLNIVPGFVYVAPTASLSTTAALAICVFFAVPIYSIANEGFLGYLKNFLLPTPLMLPFKIIGEVSRTLALAVRLFGNIMSGTKIVAILMAVAPLIFPILMHALGLLTGVIQAYIFAVLAMVYIASASRAREEEREEELLNQHSKLEEDEQKPTRAQDGVSDHG